MLRRVAAVAAAVPLILAVGPAAAPAPTTWRGVADQAVTAFAAADTGKETPHAYAYMAGAVAALHGWQDPRAKAYLAKLYTLRNPDGGWGLRYAYDAFQDGTVNPAATTYIVTLADHVGPILLDGYRAGVVPRADVQKIIDLIVSTPRIDTTAGRCLPYSRHPNDAKPGYCVHNVNAGAAAFLLNAGAAGFPVAWWLVGGITKREAAAVNHGTWWWRYRDGHPGLNGTDHNSYTAESMYVLAPPVGLPAVWKHLANTLADDPTSPIAHMRLTSLPRITAGPDWCQLGGRWIPEAATFAANPPPPKLRRLAQAAYYTALAAQACEEP